MLLSCCVFKALILLPSYKTKLGLAVGSYLQFISLSAALVKRTLSRYFSFIIFQFIFLTVYSNPLKAWNLNLSLPKIPSIIHSHWFVVELHLYVGLVPFEYLSLKEHVKSQVFCRGCGWTKGESVTNQVGCSAKRGKKQKVKFGPSNLDSVPLNISVPHTLDPRYWAFECCVLFQYELPYVTVTLAVKIRACLKQAIQLTLEEL